MLSTFLLMFALVAGRAFAAPYIVTNYVQISVYTEEAGYTETESAYTVTEDDGSIYTRTGTTVTATPYMETNIVTVVPASPIAAITTFTTSANYADVTLVDIVVASGQAVSQSYGYSRLETDSYVPITYHKASTCSGHNWTYTTNVPIYLPAAVTLTPTAVLTSTTTMSYLYEKPTITSQVVAILNPTDVSADDLASLSIEYAPYGIADCYIPTTTCSTPAATGTGTATAAVCTTTLAWDSSSDSSYGGSSGDDSFDSDYDSWFRTMILIAVLVPAGWLLLWFVVGLIESWTSFKGLMQGQHRKRGTPYAWGCVSLLFLCCVGPTYKAKSPEEQARLTEQWREMKGSRKFVLWVEWGFRWKYPVDILGEEPEIAKRALRQGCV